LKNTAEVLPQDIEVLKTKIFTDDVLEHVVVDMNSLLTTFIGKKVINKNIINNNNIEYYSIEETIKKINEKIENYEDSYLKNRIQLFVLPDYRIVNNLINSLNNNNLDSNKNLNNNKEKQLEIEKYSGDKYEPTFLIISKKVEPNIENNIEKFLQFSTFLVTFVTIFLYSNDVNSYNLNFLNDVFSGDERVVARVFFIVFGVVGLQLFHDFGFFLLFFYFF
jgi:hypothetical protein